MIHFYIYIYIYIYEFFLGLLSIIGYYKMLNILICAVQSILVAYLFYV